MSSGECDCICLVPSHVDVTFNGAVDEITKGTIRKHEVVIKCMQSKEQYLEYTVKLWRG